MLTNIQNLMASPLTGNVGWMGDAAKFGLDPNVIITANSTEDAILGLADSFQGLSKIQQLQAGKALGLDDSQIRLLQSGRENIEKYYKSIQDVGILNKQQTEQANELSGAMIDFDKTIDSIANRIGSGLSPALTDLITDFTDFYKANKDWIDLGIDDAVGVLAENLKLVAAAMALLGASGALKGLAVLRGLAGLGGAGAGGAGAGAAAGAGASAAVVATGGLAALFYSSSLNSGEDEILRQRRQGESAADMAPRVIDYFVSKGWTREQAAGIAANLETESNFDPTAVGDGGKAYGVAQWHPDRQQAFKKWTGKDIQGSTLEDQLNFVHYEMTEGAEKSAGDKLRNSTTAQEAGAVVSRYYERPLRTEDEANMRGDRAQNYLNNPPVQDNRTYTFNGADEGTIRKVLREEVGDMADQAMKDLKSSEK
jgi:hypothetical protein